MAKAIHQQLTDRTIYTQFAQMIGTPLYMSPEQAEMSGIEREASEVERNRAELESKRAGVSEQTAIEERDKANVLNTELTRSKENQRRILYGAQMNLVQKAWEMDDALQVQTLLNATRQRPGEIDLRGIEWHYWQRKLHEEDRVLQLPLRKDPAFGEGPVQTPG